MLARTFPFVSVKQQDYHHKRKQYGIDPPSEIQVLPEPGLYKIDGSVPHVERAGMNCIGSDGRPFRNGEPRSNLEEHAAREQ